MRRRVEKDISHWPKTGGVLRGSGRGGLNSASRASHGRSGNGVSLASLRPTNETKSFPSSSTPALVRAVDLRDTPHWRCTCNDGAPLHLIHLPQRLHPRARPLSLLRPHIFQIQSTEYVAHLIILAGQMPMATSTVLQVGQLRSGAAWHRRGPRPAVTTAAADDGKSKSKSESPWVSPTTHNPEP